MSHYPSGNSVEIQCIEPAGKFVFNVFLGIFDYGEQLILRNYTEKIQNSIYIWKKLFWESNSVVEQRSGVYSYWAQKFIFQIQSLFVKIKNLQRLLLMSVNGLEKILKRLVNLLLFKDKFFIINFTGVVGGWIHERKQYFILIQFYPKHFQDDKNKRLRMAGENGLDLFFSTTLQKIFDAL